MQENLKLHKGKTKKCIYSMYIYNKPAISLVSTRLPIVSALYNLQKNKHTQRLTLSHRKNEKKKIQYGMEKLYGKGIKTIVLYI